MMMTRTVYSLFFALMTIFLQAQPVNSTQTSSNDAAARLAIHYPAGSEGALPLLIFNGEKFPNIPLDQIFFNAHAIKSVQVISEKNDSVKAFGKDGKNGVILITTHNPIIWMTSDKIAKKNISDITDKPERILFNVDGKKYGAGQKLYFANGVIEQITVQNDSSEVFMDKLYKKKILISTTLKNTSQSK
jgi:hypothetical protein